ncbi:MAG TPA: endonuclease/exonuclease/phosphatase family protein [Acidimicrobiales bacterium]|nr:endonuclease/exonuclease/phosphatase family protein [Acidimicrobiales bacterium]
MRVATLNLHAGVDGWGRTTPVVERALEIGADVLITPELWRGEGGHDLFDELRERGGYEGVFAPLARALRNTSGAPGRTWQPFFAHFNGERGLFFREHRALSRAQRASHSRASQLEPGAWGLGILTRLPIEETRVIDLGRLRRERVTRALVLARLRGPSGSFWVAAVHGAHLSHGSRHQYQKINELLDELRPALPILLGGDFNAWRPVLRVFLPGWRSLVRRRTWPARHPHSQIDHLFVRGPWRTLKGFSVNAGSDHRALVADVDLG